MRSETDLRGRRLQPRGADVLDRSESHEAPLGAGHAEIHPTAV